MTFSIRITTPDEAHPFVRHLLRTQVSPPTTAAEFDDWYAEFPETGKRWEWVALDPSGRVIGYANATVEDPESAAESFETLILVDSHCQRQGLGAALLQLVEETARIHGATHLSGNLNGENPGAVAFAQRFGYSVERHTIDSQLDLAAYNEEAAFPGLLAGLAGAGIRFETLASDHGEERLRAVYHLYTQVAPTFPGATPGAPLQPYERWRERLVTAYAEQWDLVMLALAGERVVGMTRMVTEDGDQRTLYTPHTSIDPAYRGRQIGLGLKLYAMRVARERGARFLTTNNDADNHSILAINRKLGYIPTMQTLFVGKSLA